MNSRLSCVQVTGVYIYIGTVLDFAQYNENCMLSQSLFLKNCCNCYFITKFRFLFRQLSRFMDVVLLWKICYFNYQTYTLNGIPVE